MTFLRGASRPAVERGDGVCAESMAVLFASALDLVQSTGDGEEGDE